MSFAERLAAYRRNHPDCEVAEVYVTDLNGLAKGKLVPVEHLAKLAEGGMKMPVSTLGLDIFNADVPENAIAIERGDPDGVLMPVAETLAPVLWAGRPTVQLQCMMSETDGGLCAYDPRAVLLRVIERVRARGLTPVMALELEFYLIDGERPEPPVSPTAGGRLRRDQIYDLDTMRAFEPVIADIHRAARALGAPTETVICEFGAGQFEINLAHLPDPVAAADHMIALKRAIRGVARRHDLDATFMPKPYGERSGSGQHIHLSLLDAERRNLFAAESGPGPALRHAVAGMLETMAECMLIFSPHHNGYRRFVPGSYAPLVAAWGLDNRGVAVRVPETAGTAARIEHRVAGADANPYLLAAAVLAGALAGIEAGHDPGPPAATEAGPGAGAALPFSWAMAEACFAESGFVADWLGAEFRRVYAGLKRQERATLLARVSDVEYEAYLRVV